MNYWSAISLTVSSRHLKPSHQLKFADLQAIKTIADEFWDQEEAKMKGCLIFCDTKSILEVHGARIDFFVLERNGKNQKPTWFKHDHEFKIVFCERRKEKMKFELFNITSLNKEIGLYKINRNRIDECFQEQVPNIFYDIYNNELYFSPSYRDDDISTNLLSKFLIEPNKIEIVDLDEIIKIGNNFFDIEKAKQFNCKLYCVGECLLRYQSTAEASKKNPEKFQTYKDEEKLFYAILDKSDDYSYYKFLKDKTVKIADTPMPKSDPNQKQEYVDGYDKLCVNGRSIILYFLKDLDEMENIFMPRARYLYFDCDTQQLHFGDWYRSNECFGSRVSDHNDLKLKLQMKNLKLE